jgi:uncharacterized protein (TIGR03435 family)
MKDRIEFKSGFKTKVLTTLACIMGLAVPIAISAAGGKGVTPTTAAAQNTAKAFEVASVKLFVQGQSQARPGMFMNFGPPCGFTGLQLEPNRIAFTAFTYTIISIAYGKPGSNCRTPDLLTGGPEWVKSDRYDIEATIPAGTATYTLGNFAQREAPEIQMMLRTLLADRFKLKVHTQTKEISNQVLTGTAAKLTPWKEGDPTTRRITARQENGMPYAEFVAGRATMADLANMLGGTTIGTVVDKTGITGQFNVSFEFDSNGAVRPTIATRLQELGLKLEATKVTTEVVVIDSIERPSGN